MGCCKNVVATHTTKTILIDAAYPCNKSGYTIDVDNHADTTVLEIYCLPKNDFNSPMDVS